MQPFRGQHIEMHLQMSWAHGVQPRNHHHPMNHLASNHVSGKSGTAKETNTQACSIRWKPMHKMGGLKAISKCNKQQYIAVAKGNRTQKNIGNKKDTAAELEEEKNEDRKGEI